MRSSPILPAGSYQELLNSNSVLRLTDGAVIPNHPGNRDWQAYQVWLAVPNTPLPALNFPTNTISSLDFFNRFTDIEKAKVWAAAVAVPALGVGLSHGLAAGTINLADPTVKAWMDGLVVVDAITAEREVVILTPATVE